MYLAMHHAMPRPRPIFSLGTAASLLVLASTASAAEIDASPADYLDKFDTLAPGDVLKLEGGQYLDGLYIEGVQGAEGMPIVVEGPADGTPAVFVGRSCCNTIDLRDSSYLTFRNLVFDGNGEAVDAIKAGGNDSNWSHHITVEGCTVTNHSVGDTNQQIVGFSTKIVSWDWVVRGNTIDGAGTGIYFGNSDGSAAFIGGLIEGNLFLDTLGYNMQVKHQSERGQVPGVPTEQRSTVIRHNVFIKSNNPNPSGARPNLLVSGFPASGAGSDDYYEIYGNFFYHNDGDSLLQVSGRVHIHDNVFADSLNAAIALREHPTGWPLVDAYVYNNTIYDTATGISLQDTPSGTTFVVGNAIFSPNPLSSNPAGASDNVTDTVANAGNYVTNPSLTLGEMDFYPVAGSALAGASLDLSAVNSDVDFDRDFNGTEKDFSFRGAYQDEGENPGWQLDAELKPLPSGGTGGSPVGAGGSSAAGNGSGGNSSANGAGGSGNGSGGSDGTGSDSTTDEGCSCTTVGATDNARDWNARGWLLALLAFGPFFRRRR